MKKNETIIKCTDILHTDQQLSVKCNALRDTSTYNEYPNLSFATTSSTTFYCAKPTVARMLPEQSTGNDLCQITAIRYNPGLPCLPAVRVDRSERVFKRPAGPQNVKMSTWELNLSPSTPSSRTQPPYE